MSGTAERLRKMDVLLRLRKLQHDRKSFNYLYCENERAMRAHAFEVECSRYQAMHSGQGINPDTYMYRLDSIELLRQQAQSAADDLADAKQSLNSALHDLRRAELESRLAAKACDDAFHLLQAERQRQEFSEALELQLFFKKKRLV